MRRAIIHMSDNLQPIGWIIDNGTECYTPPQRKYTTIIKGLLRELTHHAIAADYHTLLIYVVVTNDDRASLRSILHRSPIRRSRYIWRAVYTVSEFTHKTALGLSDDYMLLFKSYLRKYGRIDTFKDSTTLALSFTPMTPTPDDPAEMAVTTTTLPPNTYTIVTILNYRRFFEASCNVPLDDVELAMRATWYKSASVPNSYKWRTPIDGIARTLGSATIVLDENNILMPASLNPPELLSSARVAVLSECVTVTFFPGRLASIVMCGVNKRIWMSTRFLMLGSCLPSAFTKNILPTLLSRLTARMPTPFGTTSDSSADTNVIRLRTLFTLDPLHRPPDRTAPYVIPNSRFIPVMGRRNNLKFMPAHLADRLPSESLDSGFYLLLWKHLISYQFDKPFTYRNDISEFEIAERFIAGT